MNIALDLIIFFEFFENDFSSGIYLTRLPYTVTELGGDEHLAVPHSNQNNNMFTETICPLIRKTVRLVVLSTITSLE